MRIKELFENAYFKSEDFTKQTDNGSEIDFDLADDLVYFLNNDDDTYRRCLLPAVYKFIDLKKADKEPKYTIFKSAVAKGYERYTDKYPMRELPSEIDKKSWKAACKQLFDQISKDMEDGEYDHT